ncbi:MAG: helix-turn-helix domain-containing protein [Candidatus Carbobacillus altaicus]|nr:helix-turn-helix domain-containing protein [Candidatus Carbobacillus altaicus]
MKENQKLSEWVRRIQQGDREAVEPLIERFKPKINHLSHLLGYDGAETDLILWLLTAS